MDNSNTNAHHGHAVVLTATHDGSHYTLDKETLIGREVECSITLNSVHISRYHAKIYVSHDGLTVEDLQSSNGTFVNGRRIKTRTQVSLGDEISFDKLRFRLTSESSGREDATVLKPHQVPIKPDTAKMDGNRERAHNSKQVSQKAPRAQTGSSSLNLQRGLENNRMNALDPGRNSRQADDDNTRMLSSEQMDKIASINKFFQKFVDTGSGPRLVATTAPIRGKVFQLSSAGEDRSWQIGRRRDCDICVADPSVSRLHGRMFINEGRFYVETVDPHKAILVNGKNTDNMMLRQNDLLQIGHLEFVFRLDEQRVEKEPSTNSEEAITGRFRTVSFIGISMLLFILMATVLWLA